MRELEARYTTLTQIEGDASYRLATLSIRPRVSRIAGSTAHVYEQQSDNRLIPTLANYTGQHQVPWTPIGNRVSARTGKIMLQQLTIKTSNKATLIPVLRSAMEGEKRVIAFGLQKTRLRLVDFEQQFSMSSAEFERRLNWGELERRR